MEPLNNQGKSFFHSFFCLVDSFVQKYRDFELNNEEHMNVVVRVCNVICLT